MGKGFTKSDYQVNLRSVFNLAALVRGLRIQEVLGAMERAEGIGPVLDPTLYITAADQLEWQKRTVEAALEFQRKVEEIAADPKYQEGG